VMADPRLNANPLVETAIAALAATTTLVSALPSTAQYSIENVEASLDDESSRIEIRVDGQVGVANGNVTLQELSFQVTTLAKL
jgi:biopolymer transport protein ExbD